MDESVFVALVEIRPTDGCALNPADVAGGMVRCYVSATTAAKAENRVRESLTQDLFSVVEVEWCVDDATTDWEKPDNTEGEAYADEARQSGDVVYGEFHTWGHED